MPVAGLVSAMGVGGEFVCRPVTGRAVAEGVGSMLVTLMGVTVGAVVATAVGNGTTGHSGASRVA